ncbi:hypothetical protein SELMODRAFT_417567 [Selaginella moellendorffii]|uniref:Uncharacterized protein n=1 Tax=Selaginella moellendorffii TaxID=88036 RepID=D8S2W0_SELML|nr:hypothetical protein SELMODRAFT_417567 [Selaginella moellendorffii]
MVLMLQKINLVKVDLALSTLTFCTSRVFNFPRLRAVNRQALSVHIQEDVQFIKALCNTSQQLNLRSQLQIFVTGGEAMLQEIMVRPLLQVLPGRVPSEEKFKRITMDAFHNIISQCFQNERRSGGSWDWVSGNVEEHYYIRAYLD